jgi:hypothetical protein
MRGEALLYWLSQLGEGAHNRFRSAVASILPPDGDATRMLQFWTNRLSDLGHADFFLNGSRRWRVRQPVLAGLCGLEGAAVLCGARSPNIVQSLKAVAEKHGCHLEYNALPDLPAQILVVGDNEQLKKTAGECRLNYIPQYAERLCRELMPISACVGRVSDEPAKWQVRSFHFESRNWIKGRLPKAAREYKSKYGELRYFWSDWQGKLRPASKREAIYASAAAQNVKLAAYDLGSRSLTVPAKTPLPEAYMRVACLCSGIPPRYKDGVLLFESIPPAIASILLVSAGQPHPGVPMLQPKGFKEGLEAYERPLQAIR